MAAVSAAGSEVLPKASMEESRSDSVSMQDFALIRVLGKGAYGKVFLVKKIGGPDSNRFYAMKVIKKERLVAKQKTLEHALMERQVLERPAGMPLPQYVGGGELFLHLCNRRFFPPPEAKILLGELAFALNYIHENACVIVFELLTGCSPFTVDGDHNSAQEVARRVLNKPVPFPKTMDETSRQFINSLLDRNPKTRLGTNGFDAIKHHAFFEGIDWELLEQRKIKKPVFTPADTTTTFQSIFRGYSFVSPSVIFATNNVIGEESMQDNIEVLSKNSPFFDKYELSSDDDGLLGKGSFLDLPCRRKSDGKLFAVKIVSERFVHHARREIRILEQVNSHPANPHVVQIEEALSDQFYHYIVEELLTGGELFERLRKMQKFTGGTGGEKNIIFENNHPDAALKLVDFGFARLLPNAMETMSTPCFSLSFAAPELLEMDDELPSYNQQCDLWSIGVILFTMLSGNVPFHFKNKHESATDIIGRIRTADFEMTDSVWDCVSNTAKHLITGLLTVDPKKRLKMSQLVNHPWLKQAENGEAPNQARELKTPTVLPESAGECFNETMNAFLNANRDGFQLSNVEAAPLLVKRRGMKRRSSSFSKKSVGSSAVGGQKLDAVPESSEVSCSTSSKRPTTLNFDMAEEPEEVNGNHAAGTSSGLLSAAFTEIRDTKPPELKYSRNE
ncbi:Ribosomal protein S6 kinase [Aphelenchoides fujianensis]|nr:Ribosomal protein S6 kinase [Aphelenchoides fujianensis]